MVQRRTICPEKQKKKKLHAAHGKEVLPVAAELCECTPETESADKCSPVTLSAEVKTSELDKSTLVSAAVHVLEWE